MARKHTFKGDSDSSAGESHELEFTAGSDGASPDARGAKEQESNHERLQIPHVSELEPSHHKRWLGWGLVALLAIGLLVAPAYTWMDYKAQHVTSTNATVRAHLAKIGTRIDGLVTHVHVQAGDQVAAGQILVTLEDSHLMAEVDEAKAALSGLEQSVEIERLAIVHERLKAREQEQEAGARVAAAEAQAVAAKVRAEEAFRFHDVRKSLLARGGAISGEDVRNAESERRAAEALLEEAEANYVAAKSAKENARLASDALAIRERRIGVLESDIVRARARLLRAQAELKAASIVAPEDGRIVRRFVQPGGSVEVGQPIISMWLGKDVWIEAWINEEDIHSVEIGSEATLTLHAFPNREFAGTVDKIGLVTDFELPEGEVPQPRNSRMRGTPVVGVRIKLLETPEELLPGLSAVVAIEKPTV